MKIYTGNSKILYPNVVGTFATLPFIIKKITMIIFFHKDVQLHKNYLSHF